MDVEGTEEGYLSRDIGRERWPLQGKEFRCYYGSSEDEMYDDERGVVVADAVHWKPRMMLTCAVFGQDHTYSA
jgi:hypothetical protein